MSDAKVKRQMKAVLAEAERVCVGNPQEVMATLIGAIGTFCVQRQGAPQLLAIAIETLERAKAEIETGAPMLNIPTEKPS